MADAERQRRERAAWLDNEAVRRLTLEAERTQQLRGTPWRRLLDATAKALGFGNSPVEQATRLRQELELQADVRGLSTPTSKVTLRRCRAASSLIFFRTKR
jgi:hypothetical protein